MTFWEVFAIAVGLAMDATAVSLAAGASALARGARFHFRLAFHFGLFQFMMPVAGWIIGATLARYIAAVDHWVAFGILAFVGGRMIAEGCSGERSSDPRDPSRGLTLVMLSLATSIDALAVGVSYSVIGAPIWLAAGIIGAVTFALCLIGCEFGKRIGARFERWAEVAGGVALIGIGAKILIEHLVA